MAQHGMTVRYKGRWGDADKWVLHACPFNPDHNDKSAIVVRFDTGRLGFRCHHNSCQGKRWQAVRDWFEPDRKRSTSGPVDTARHEPAAGHSANRGDSEARQDLAANSIAEWESRLPFPSLLPPVPKMTIDMLPHGLRPWLSDIADRVQCPLEYVAVSAIVDIASVIGRKVGIYPKQRDDWLVIPNLWGMLIGRPGVLKTPAMVEAMKPLDRLVTQALNDHARAMKEYLLASSVHDAKLKVVKGEMVTAVKKSDNTGMERHRITLHELQGEIPELPVALRYKTNDSTVEKLQALLAENPHGLPLYRDELAGFLYALEKAGREGDREFYLECCWL